MARIEMRRVRSPKSEVRCPESGVRGPKPAFRRPKLEASESKVGGFSPELRIPDSEFRPWISDFARRTTDSEFRPWNSDFGHRTSDPRLRTADCDSDSGPRTGFIKTPAPQKSGRLPKAGRRCKGGHSRCSQ